MIGTRHYERILTLPTYSICRKSLALLALLLGILPVGVYVGAMFLVSSSGEVGPRIGQTAAVILTIFIGVVALICPLTAAVVNKVLVERNLGRPPFRFLYEGEEEQGDKARPKEPELRPKKPFETQFVSMSAVLFAISDATALFGLVLGVLGRGWGYAIPFFVFSLIFSFALYVTLKNQLFGLLSHHFDVIEGGGKIKLAE